MYFLNSENRVKLRLGLFVFKINLINRTRGDVYMLEILSEQEKNDESSFYTTQFCYQASEFGVKAPLPLTVFSFGFIYFSEAYFGRTFLGYAKA